MKTCRRCKLPMVKSGNHYFCQCGYIEKKSNRQQTVRLKGERLIPIEESEDMLQIARHLQCSLPVQACRNVLVRRRYYNNELFIFKGNITEMHRVEFNECRLSQLQSLRTSSTMGTNLLIIV